METKINSLSKFIEAMVSLNKSRFLVENFLIGGYSVVHRIGLKDLKDLDFWAKAHSLCPSAKEALIARR